MLVNNPSPAAQALIGRAIEREARGNRNKDFACVLFRDGPHETPEGTYVEFAYVEFATDDEKKAQRFARNYDNYGPATKMVVVDRRGRLY